MPNRWFANWGQVLQAGLAAAAIVVTIVVAIIARAGSVSVPSWVVPLLAGVAIGSGLAGAVLVLMRLVRPPVSVPLEAARDKSPITITLPRPLELLSESPLPLGENKRSYVVRGELEHIPVDHTIWLLVESQQSKEFWPQGFFTVEYDPHASAWLGRVNGRSGQKFRVHAVVASPAIDQFFRYWQKVGPKTDWASIDHIPAECTNRVSVQTEFPIW